MLFHRLHERQNRRERVFRDRTNQLNYMSDPELISRYRLPRQAIENLIDLIKVDIEPQTFRSHALDATTKVSIIGIERVSLLRITLYKARNRF